MKTYTKKQLDELAKSMFDDYSGNENPLSALREETGRDVRFEYQNGQNDFFLSANTKEAICETIGAEIKNAPLYVLLNGTYSNILGVVIHDVKTGERGEY